MGRSTVRVCVCVCVCVCVGGGGQVITLESIMYKAYNVVHVPVAQQSI